MSAQDPELNLQNALDSLYAIFDITPTSRQETVDFQKYSQEELSEAMKYWFDQNKVFFGEPVQTEIIHGMREEGLDITIDLLKSKIRFGLQIKTYGDIQEKAFADKIHSQTNRSKKHGLSKYILAFAGDLNDRSQNEKVSGIISEIHQSKDDDYVLVVSPINLLTIYNVYKDKGNPSQFFNLNIERVATLGRGLSKALSNEKREAKVTISFNYLVKTRVDGTKASIKFALDKSEVSLLDKIENLQNTNERVVIPKEKIKEFIVSENGKPIFQGIDSDIIIEPEKKFVNLTLQAVSEKDKVIDSIEDLKLEVKEENKILSWKTASEDEPCRFLIEYDRTKDLANIKFTIDYSRSDAKKIIKRLNFITSLKDTLKLRIRGLTRAESVSDIGIKNIPTIPKFLLDLIKALALIQEKTGYILTLPSILSEVSEANLRNIFLVSKVIEKGIIKYKSFNANVVFPRIQALSLLREFINKGEMKNLSYRSDMYTVTLLGTEIRLGPTNLVSPLVKFSGAAKKVYKDLLKSNIDSYELELELMNPELRFEWFKKEDVQH